MDACEEVGMELETVIVSDTVPRYKVVSARWGGSFCLKLHVRVLGEGEFA